MSNEEMLENLRQEENQLMNEIAKIQSGSMEKNAQKQSQIESRLQQVRHKISELDGVDISGGSYEETDT